jgi:hypothetical protein
MSTINKVHSVLDCHVVVADMTESLVLTFWRDFENRLRVSRQRVIAWGIDRQSGNVIPISADGVPLDDDFNQEWCIEQRTVNGMQWIFPNQMQFSQFAEVEREVQWRIAMRIQDRELAEEAQQDDRHH